MIVNEFDYSMQECFQFNCDGIEYIRHFRWSPKTFRLRWFNLNGKPNCCQWWLQHIIFPFFSYTTRRCIFFSFFLLRFCFCLSFVSFCFNVIAEVVLSNSNLVFSRHSAIRIFFTLLCAYIIQPLSERDVGRRLFIQYVHWTLAGISATIHFNVLCPTLASLFFLFFLLLF